MPPIPAARPPASASGPTDAGAEGAPAPAAVFRSALVNAVDIQTPELHVRTLTLLRNIRVDHAIAAQRRRWSRAILYLHGWGQQMFSHECAAVESGMLVVLPPGQAHAFRPASSGPASCLVVDFQLKRARPPVRRVCAINRDALAQTREEIGYLLRVQSHAGHRAGAEGSAVVLQLTIRLLQAAGWLERPPVAAHPAAGSAMHRMLLGMELDSPLRQIVQRSGYQRDHLNRLVKKETGLTLGQFRTQRRLAAAKELLARGFKVGDVAGGVGLPDPSYFARWFRRQTGQSPSCWLRAGPEETPLGFAALPPPVPPHLPRAVGAGVDFAD